MPRFIMFSAHQRKGFQDFVLERGVDQIIEKPPNQDEIFSLVVKAMVESSKQSLPSSVATD